jgi:hypothetical protein
MSAQASRNTRSHATPSTDVTYLCRPHRPPARARTRQIRHMAGQSGFLGELDGGHDAVMVGAGHSYGASHQHGGSPGNQDVIQAHNR